MDQKRSLPTLAVAVAAPHMVISLAELKLTVNGTLTVDGYLTANGINGLGDTTYSSGGGSGGSIYLVAGVLAGSGVIRPTAVIRLLRATEEEAARADALHVLCRF
jgi:hypothetical protein